MKYFKESEFNMGGEPCFDKMNPRILGALSTLRGYVNKPFIVKSSYRGEEYNELVGGSKNSQHLLGNAADISTVGWTGADKYNFITCATDLGLSIGIYKTFFHVDCRNTTPVMWTG